MKNEGQFIRPRFELISIHCLWPSVFFKQLSLTHQLFGQKKEKLRDLSGAMQPHLLLFHIAKIHRSYICSLRLLKNIALYQDTSYLKWHNRLKNTAFLSAVSDWWSQESSAWCTAADMSMGCTVQGTMRWHTRSKKKRHSILPRRCRGWEWDGRLNATKIVPIWWAIEQIRLFQARAFLDAESELV